MSPGREMRPPMEAQPEPPTKATTQSVAAGTDIVQEARSRDEGRPDEGTPFANRAAPDHTLRGGLW
jgi:hypothetical protein